MYFFHVFLEESLQPSKNCLFSGASLARNRRQGETPGKIPEKNMPEFAPISGVWVEGILVYQGEDRGEFDIFNEK